MIIFSHNKTGLSWEQTWEPCHYASYVKQEANKTAWIWCWDQLTKVQIMIMSFSLAFQTYAFAVKQVMGKGVCVCLVKWSISSCFLSPPPVHCPSIQQSRRSKFKEQSQNGMKFIYQSLKHNDCSQVSSGINLWPCEWVSMIALSVWMSVCVCYLPSESMLLSAVGGMMETLHWPRGHLRGYRSIQAVCT